MKKEPRRLKPWELRKKRKEPNTPIQFGWYKIKAFFMWIAATVAAFIDVLI
jgi:hypothetical protein